MGLPASAKCSSLPVSKALFKRSPALLIRNQSATALGATWDTSLVELLASFKILAQEAKLRATSLVLAPTCNIQRVSRLICYLPLLWHFKTESIGGPCESSRQWSDRLLSVLVELRMFFRRPHFIWHDGCLICEWCPKSGDIRKRGKILSRLSQA